MGSREEIVVQQQQQQQQMQPVTSTGIGPVHVIATCMVIFIVAILRVIWQTLMREMESLPRRTNSVITKVWKSASALNLWKMKNRKSNVTHEHQQVLEELKSRKIILAHKFTSNPTKNIKKKECFKVSEPPLVQKNNIDNNKLKWLKHSAAEKIQCLKVPEPQPVQRNNINNLQWLEERAAENVRQSTRAGQTH